jgi:hypothetical protein
LGQAPARQSSSSSRSLRSSHIMMFVDPGAIGECGARTQGASIRSSGLSGSRPLRRRLGGASGGSRMPASGRGHRNGLPGHESGRRSSELHSLRTAVLSHGARRGVTWTPHCRHTGATEDAAARRRAWPGDTTFIV